MAMITGMLEQPFFSDRDVDWHTYVPPIGGPGFTCIVVIDARRGSISSAVAVGSALDVLHERP